MEHFAFLIGIGVMFIATIFKNKWLFWPLVTMGFIISIFGGTLLTKLKT